MRTTRYAVLAITILTCCGVQLTAQPSPPAGRSVVINRVPLTEAQVTALEHLYRTRIQDGNYWYDRRSGAWGVEGGPTMGFIHAGINVGGALRADASNGRTGVFINGRQLHALDVAGLSQLGPVRPGRYWVDAYGNCGYEGGPAFVNLVQLARARGSRGPWTVSGTGGTVGGDGDGFLFYQGKDSSGRVISWSN